MEKKEAQWVWGAAALPANFCSLTAEKKKCPQEGPSCGQEAKLSLGCTWHGCQFCCGIGCLFGKHLNGCSAYENAISPLHCRYCALRYDGRTGVWKPDLNTSHYAYFKETWITLHFLKLPVCDDHIELHVRTFRDSKHELNNCLRHGDVSAEHECDVWRPAFSTDNKLFRWPRIPKRKTRVYQEKLTQIACYAYSSDKDAAAFLLAAQR